MRDERLYLTDIVEAANAIARFGRSGETGRDHLLHIPGV